MKIETKFEINEKVYVVKKQTAYEKNPCPACEGQGYLIGKDKKQYQCPNSKCENGIITTINKNKYVANKRRIIGIFFSIEKDLNSTYFHSKLNYETNDCDYFKETEIFKTRKEAEHEALNRNKNTK